MTTRVKICGLTRVEDALYAAALGADYLGFVFVEESPRYVDPLVCGSIADALAPHSRTVGVFRNAPIEEVRRIAEIARLDLVQLHGDETYRLELPTIKAFNVKDTLPDTSTEADYLLFDTGGGTGRTFDWTLLAGYPRTKPFFLAGGITPENVAEAVARTNPFGIDVSSGVEESPGVKDHRKLRTLFERIRR